jgi:predicted ATP-grasp superfamily ATP-dependent carboligase
MPHLSVLLLEGTPAAYHMAASLVQQRDVEVHCLSDVKSFARLSRYFTSFLLHERFAEPADLLACVKQGVVRTGANVVLPVTERSTRWLSQHRNVLQEFVSVPPLPGLETIETVSDKRKLWEFQRDHNLSGAPTVYAVGPRTGDAFENSCLDFPLLLKPSVGENGEGITLIKTPDELTVWKQTAGDNRREYIAQKYISGRDIDCSLLSLDGEIVVHTVQQRASAKSGATLEVFSGGEALEAVRPLIRTIRYSGIAHIDMRQDAVDGRFTIVDFNPRCWASLFSSTCAGVNFPYLWCQLASKQPVVQPIFEKIHHYSSSATMRHCVQRILRPTRARTEFKWKNSSLPSALGDPLPLLARAGARLRRTIYGNQRGSRPVRFAGTGCASLTYPRD